MLAPAVRVEIITITVAEGCKYKRTCIPIFKALIIFNQVEMLITIVMGRQYYN